jgi:TonB family protein
MPLQILDTDYPFESLLASEEGRTGLNLILDTTGRVRTSKIISSSGHPLLDGKAAQIARSWTFQPGAQNGDVKVQIDWKLALSSADEYAIGLPGPPDGSILVPPEPSSVHSVIASDYPAVSIRLQEQGEAAVRFRVREDGTTDEVQILGSSV